MRQVYLSDATWLIEKLGAEKDPNIEVSYPDVSLGREEH